MGRAVVNVAAEDERFRAGQARLVETLRARREDFIVWEQLPIACPRHVDVPFAFKAYALNLAARRWQTLLWCDSSILPIRPLEPLWERIERDGYWFANNAGWSNYQWTADSAYPELFPEVFREAVDADPIAWSRTMNRHIPHVVATAFGISTAHPKGRKFLDEYYRLASETQAFCGPWVNGPKYHDNPRQAPCGPPDVLGHRH